MNRIKFTASLLLIAVLASSCASILGGYRDGTKVEQGYPENAQVYFNGEYQGTAPTKIQIPKNSNPRKDFIEVKAPGYETQKISINRRVSVGFTLMDLGLTLGVGLLLDFANGNIYKIRPKNVNYYLVEDTDYNPSKNFNYLVGDTVYFKNDEYDGYKGTIEALFPDKAVIKFKRPPNIAEIDKGIKEEVIDITQARYRDIAIATRNGSLRIRGNSAPTPKPTMQVKAIENKVIAPDTTVAPKPVLEKKVEEEDKPVIKIKVG